MLLVTHSKHVYTHTRIESGLMIVCACGCVCVRGVAGGITGWLKVATLCEAHNLPVSSHGMQELHVSLLAAVPNAGWMEVHSFPIDRYTEAGVVSATDGYVTPPDVPGTGVTFLWDRLAPHEVKL
jgi:L-alanine-DL-glutamate epimerase-like enolase superfamily enzyme